MKLSKILQILAVSLALAGYSAWIRPETSGIPLLRPDEARRLWAKDRTLFVDVRPAPDYEFGHIPGAVHFPEEEFEQRFPALEGRLRKAKAVVVYCKSQDCGASYWMALRLRNAGLTRVMIFPEGWNEWYLRGFPTTIKK